MYSQILKVLQYLRRPAIEKLTLASHIFHVPKFISPFMKCLFKQHIVSILQDTLLKCFQWDQKYDSDSISQVS